MPYLHIRVENSIFLLSLTSFFNNVHIDEEKKTGFVAHFITGGDTNEMGAQRIANTDRCTPSSVHRIRENKTSFSVERELKTAHEMQMELSTECYTCDSKCYLLKRISRLIWCHYSTCFFCSLSLCLSACLASFSPFMNQDTFIIWYSVSNVLWMLCFNFNWQRDEHTHTHGVRVIDTVTADNETVSLSSSIGSVEWRQSYLYIHTGTLLFHRNIW